MTLLTVDEFREHVTTSLGGDAIQRLLDDAEAQIDAFAGAVGSAVDLVTGGGSRIVTTRPIASVTTVVERDGGSSPVSLATDDWELFGTFLLLRSRHGTNDASYWRGPVRVTYTPVDDTDTRKIVQLELVRLEMTTNPGLASETVGAWTQTYSSIGSKSVPEQRGDILSRLHQAAGFAVV
jgi:hypothetical protein